MSKVHPRIKFRLESIGNYTSKIGVSLSSKTEDLGLSWDSWCLTSEGDLLHKSEQAEGYCSHLNKDDVIELAIDYKEGTLEFIINGDAKGIAFENSHFKNSKLIPMLNISQNTEVKIC